MYYLWYELKNCQKYNSVHAQKECFSFFNEMVAMVLKKIFHQTKIEVNFNQTAKSIFCIFMERRRKSELFESKCPNRAKTRETIKYFIRKNSDRKV